MLTSLLLLPGPARDLVRLFRRPWSVVVHEPIPNARVRSASYQGFALGHLTPYKDIHWLHQGPLVIKLRSIVEVPDFSLPRVSVSLCHEVSQSLGADIPSWMEQHPQLVTSFPIYFSNGKGQASLWKDTLARLFSPDRLIKGNLARLSFLLDAYHQESSANYPLIRAVHRSLMDHNLSLPHRKDAYTHLALSPTYVPGQGMVFYPNMPKPTYTFSSAHQRIQVINVLHALTTEVGIQQYLR